MICGLSKPSLLFSVVKDVQSTIDERVWGLFRRWLACFTLPKLHEIDIMDKPNYWFTNELPFISRLHVQIIETCLYLTLPGVGHRAPFAWFILAINRYAHSYVNLFVPTLFLLFALLHSMHVVVQV